MEFNYLNLPTHLCSYLRPSPLLFSPHLQVLCLLFPRSSFPQLKAVLRDDQAVIRFHLKGDFKLCVKTDHNLEAQT